MPGDFDFVPKGGAMRGRGALNLAGRTPNRLAPSVPSDHTAALPNAASPTSRLETSTQLPPANGEWQKQSTPRDSRQDSGWERDVELNFFDPFATPELNAPSPDFTAPPSSAETTELSQTPTTGSGAGYNPFDDEQGAAPPRSGSSAQHSAATPHDEIHTPISAGSLRKDEPLDMHVTRNHAPQGGDEWDIDPFAMPNTVDNTPYNAHSAEDASAPGGDLEEFPSSRQDHNEAHAEIASPPPEVETDFFYRTSPNTRAYPEDLPVTRAPATGSLETDAMAGDAAEGHGLHANTAERTMSPSRAKGGLNVQVFAAYCIAGIFLLTGGGFATYVAYHLIKGPSGAAVPRPAYIQSAQPNQVTTPPVAQPEFTRNATGSTGTHQDDLAPTFQSGPDNQYLTNEAVGANQVPQKQHTATTHTSNTYAHTTSTNSLAQGLNAPSIDPSQVAPPVASSATLPKNPPSTSTESNAQFQNPMDKTTATAAIGAPRNDPERASLEVVTAQLKQEQAAIDQQDSQIQKLAAAAQAAEDKNSASIALIENTLLSLQTAVTAIQNSQSSQAAPTSTYPVPRVDQDHQRQKQSVDDPRCSNLNVIDGYGLEGIDQTDAVIRTPSGQFTFNMGAQIPGAGTLQTAIKCAGVWNAVTTQGLIAPQIGN